MRFADSETQALIRRTARAFFAERYPHERLYEIERGDAALSRADLRELADLGWLALAAPESHGGGGVSLLEAAVVIDECGYAAAPLPIALSNIAADLLAHADSGAEHVGRIARGERWYTVAAGERRLSRRADDNASTGGGIARGVLSLVPFGAVADHVVAPVAIDGAPAVAAIDLAGTEREAIRTLDRRTDAHVRLDGLDAAALTVLARGAEADALHDRCDALGTVLGLVEMAGLLQRVLEMTVDYISHRVQFGQPIAKFQAARHRAADLLTQAETVRWTAYHALWRFQVDPDDTSEIWLAKHWAIRATERAFQVTHLLHGGVGVGTDYPLHLYTQALGAFAVRNGGMDEMTSRALGHLDIGTGGITPATAR